MPLTRVSMIKSRSLEAKNEIRDIIGQVIVDHLKVPSDDRFLIIEELEKENFNFHPTCLEIERSDELLIVQIFLNIGRPTEMKKEFYKELSKQLHQSANVRTEDLFINLIEVTQDNWSYGDGIAQFAL